jgi:predicted metal-dependent peptidase
MEITFKIFDEFDKIHAKKKYYEMLEYINYLLIHSESTLDFFGYFYMNLKKKILFLEEVRIWTSDQCIKDGVVYIEDDSIVFIIDPTLINDKFAIFKLLFKILHEILHVVLKHNQRKPEGLKEKLLFNLSADHIVNTILYEFHLNKAVTKLDIFPETEFFIKRLYEKDKTPSVEAFYQFLKSSKDFEIKAKKIKIPLINFKASDLEDMFDNIDVEDDTKKYKIVMEDVLDVLDTNQRLLTELSPIINKEKDNVESNETADLNMYMKTDKSFINKLFCNKNAKLIPINDPEFSDSIELNSDTDEKINKNFFENFDDTQCLTIVIIQVYDKVDKKYYKSIYDLSKDNQKFVKETENTAPVLFYNYKEKLERAFYSSCRGFGTSNGISMFEDIYKVVYPWENILENAINMRTRKSEEKSFARQNVRKMQIAQKFNTIFAGNIIDELPDTLLACIDVSGSMMEDDLKKAISVLCDSVNKYSKIIIITHDEAITEIIFIDNTSDKDAIFEKIRKLKGRGGTAHRDVFKKIEEMSLEYKLSTIIFFTDYDSDVRNIYKNYEFLKFNMTIWCINNKKKNKDFSLGFDDSINHLLIHIEDTIKK